jgi:drug/metabolite transporter superfamily protein YnfA
VRVRFLRVCNHQQMQEVKWTPRKLIAAIKSVLWCRCAGRLLLSCNVASATTVRSRLFGRNYACRLPVCVFSFLFKQWQVDSVHVNIEVLTAVISLVIKLGWTDALRKKRCTGYCRRRYLYPTAHAILYGIVVKCMIMRKT